MYVQTDQSNLMCSRCGTKYYKVEWNSFEGWMSMFIKCQICGHTKCVTSAMYIAPKTKFDDLSGYHLFGIKDEEF